MGIKIKSINIKELGPINYSISFELGILNLIYGHNEKGKTFLVEFIIQSLFKNRSRWNFRQINSNGKIIIDGLEEEFTELSPASDKKKLEDLLDKEYPGLPPDLSKLMIVKGAELVFDDSENIEGGINKTIIKNYLSSRGVFEKIRNRISKTIQGAIINNRNIEGSNKGELNKRKEIHNKINDIDNLFIDINNNYSSGSIKELENESIKLENKKNGLLCAKQHLAFQKNKELKNTKAENDQIDQNILTEIDKEITNYKIQSNKYKSKKAEQKEYEEKSSHYEWLKNASEIYEKSGTHKPGVVKWIMGLIFFSLISIIVFSIFNITWGVILSTIACAVIILCYLFYQRIIKIDSDLQKEKQKIEEDFKERFKVKLKNKAHLKTFRDRINEYYNKNNILQDQLKTEREDLNALETNININFQKIGINDIGKEKWDNKLKELQDIKKSFNDTISDLDKELASLNIDPSDYKETENEYEYSREDLDNVEAELDEIKKNITNNTNKLETLKQRICDITRNNINESWDAIISSLKERQDEVIKEYKDITAEILGKISVCKVLEKLEAEEDKKIFEVLDSDLIKKPLFELTHRYKGIRIENDELIVKDDFNEFNLKDLSTGAMEQILLALRIGFITKLFKKENNFLILDDAFQYSDWERRSFIIDKMIELAHKECQIIYFTMDDHIKDLFNQKGQQFGNRYKSYELK